MAGIPSLDLDDDAQPILDVNLNAGRSRRR